MYFLYSIGLFYTIPQERSTIISDNVFSGQYFRAMQCSRQVLRDIFGTVSIPARHIL